MLGSLGCACLEDAFTPKLTEEEFEQLLKFLSVVPLFRKQLSKADLPLVAQALKRTAWEPGVHVVEQGAEGKAFFIIQEGEAKVVVKDPEGVESVRALLYHGDYFGGHTLIEKRPNVGTIIARGPHNLVTLSMSRKNFELLGLHKKLKFPRRPAIYDGLRTDALVNHTTVSRTLKPNQTMSTADEALICKAVRSNANLKRALGDVADDKVLQIARVATRRVVEAGTIIARTGDLPTDFYVVAQGSFDIISGCDAGHRSVEATVASQRSARARFLLKERFLHDLATAVPQTQSKGQGNDTGPQKYRSKTMVLASKPGANGKERRTSFFGRKNGMVGKEASQEAAAIQRFRVGEFVARLVVGRDSVAQESGKVVEVIGDWPDGEVLVDFFEPPRRERLRMQHLRPAKDTVTIANVKPGSTYGELALLYNARLVTDFKACEDSVVYAINRWHFKECFSRDCPQLEEHCELLNEVHLLTPLLQAERFELARNATGVLQFQPGVEVLTQGESYRDVLFYVIKKGSCLLRMATTNEAGEQVVKEIARYQRGGCFGERMILRKTDKPEFTVEAGPDGMTCLVIDGQILQSFFLNAGGKTTDFGMPGMQCDASEYHTQIMVSRGRSRKRIVEHTLAGLQVVSLLGEGGFGAVFLVRAGPQEYALKRISKGFAQQAGVTKQIGLERDVLSMVDSPFIVQLFQTYKDDEYVYILMELADGGHLYQILCSWRAERHGPDASAAMYYVASVSYALEHLHERNIAYRDLKLENVLLDTHGYVKLCDMGFAKFIFKKSHTLCGTPEYMAPEMIDTPHAHDRNCDWWALGVMAFELLTGQVPWDSSGLDDDEDPMAYLLHIRGSHDRGIHESLIPTSEMAARAFISRLLTVKVKSRLGYRGGEEVRNDNWFKSRRFDFEALLNRTLPPPHPGIASEAARLVPAEMNPTMRSSHLQTQDHLYAPYENDGSGWDESF